MTITPSASTLTREQYRRLVYGVVGVGILGLLGGMALDRPLVGTVVYLLGAWIGGGIAVVAPMVSDARLQDERDYELHNRASGVTMAVAMTLGLGIIPVLYVLDAGDYVDLGGAVGGAIMAVSALFLLYGVCFGIVKRRN